MTARSGVAPTPGEDAPCRGWATHASLAGLAVVAGLYQGVLTTRAVNDTFLHLAMSRQVVHGDLPIRDFFDSGLVLMYTISAAAQQAFGYRLLAEAIVVGVMVALATLVTGHVVHRLTGSLPGAIFTELLILTAAPRPYSYPKLVVYAGAAALWWAYAARPTDWRASALGAWTAIAFYFRPDHGVYMAIAAVLAALVTDGVTSTGLRRVATAGSVCLLLVVPWFVFAQRTIGFDAYVSAGLAQGVSEELKTSAHALPQWPARTPSDVVRVDPAEAFAPIVSLRWAPGTSDVDRRAVLDRYRLKEIDGGGNVTRVRFSSVAAEHLHELIAEPGIEDTAGIERGSATLSTSGWPFWQRIAFRSAPFRLRILPALDDQHAASDAATVLFQLIPVAALVVAVLFRNRLTGLVTPARLIAFSIVTLIVNAGLIRSSYDVRTVDAVVLPALLAGCGIAALLHVARRSGALPRVVAIAAIVVAVLLAGKSVAGAGSLPDHLSYLTGEWGDGEHLHARWADIRRHLVASPPGDYWRDRTPPGEVQLALYARACVPAGERLMVLWFAPEIYYYSDRLMAQRHLVFIPGWASVTNEQRLSVEKARAAAPPLVFASAPRLDTVTREIYPALVDEVHRNYEPVATVSGDEDYLILARRGRAAVRRYGEHNWPCYADHS